MSTPSGPRALDAVVLVIGLLGIVLICALFVSFAGWFGLAMAGPFIGMLLILTVGLA